MWRRGLLCLLLALAGSSCLALAQEFSLPSKEQPVGLVVASEGGRLLRAGSELSLAAQPGDLLFPGDALFSEQGRLTFLFCPDRSAQSLPPNGQVVFEAARLQVRQGQLADRADTRYCLLPMVPRAPSASRYHAGDTYTRDLPAAPAEDFQARLAALPEPQRAALMAELAPVDAALAANPEDGGALLARATLLERYGLGLDAAAHYKKVSQIWTGADWTRLLVHDAVSEAETPAAAEGPGQTYALLVGISQYQRLAPEEQLHFAHRDAATFYEYLSSPRGGALPPENITLLTDEQATTAAIRTAMETFLKARAGRNDNLLLFIAAHGTVAETASGREAFIVTYDSDPQDLGSTGLPMADVQALMQNQLSKVGRVTLYIDVCRAGIIGTIKNNTVNGSVEQLFEEEGDLFGFLASRPRELSIESERFGGGHGAFTYFLLRALNGDADGYVTEQKDGVVSLNEVVEYVRDQVREATRNKQHPVERINVSGDPELAEVNKAGITLADWSMAATTEIAQRALAPPPFSQQRPTPSTEDEEVARFEEAIQAGNLLPGIPGSAYERLQPLRPRVDPQEYLLLEDDLRIALEDRSQQVLLRYLTGDQIPQTRADFDTGAAHLAANALITPGSPYVEGRLAFFRGRVMIFDKLYPEAVQQLERAVRLDPNGAYSYNALGIAYLEQAQYEQAARAFRDAAARAPYWAYPLHNLALTYTEMGNYQAGIRTYQQAMALAPQYSYLPYNLGLLYQRLNRRGDAERQYRRAIQITPDLAAAYNGLGVLSASAGRARQAEELYREALARDSSLLAARHNLALLLSTQPQRQAEAVDLLRQNLAQSPDEIASRLLLAELLTRQGDTVEAVSQYQRIVSERPDYVAARVALADLLTSGSRMEEALEQLQAALQTQPLNAAVFERIGDIEKARGRAAEARAAYQQALEHARDGKARRAIRAKMP